MEFILQEGFAPGAPHCLNREPRMFIDTELHKGNKQVDVIEAPDWQDARAQVLFFA